jgi:hypothetical protein
MNFSRHPVLAGVSIGILLAIAISVFAPASDVPPQDSRVLMAVVGTLFLIPICIGTVYAARFAPRNIREIPPLRFFWIGAVAFFTIAVVTSELSARQSAHRFALGGQATSGTVIETHPEDHNTLLVAYAVSGVDYRCRSEGPRVARSYKPGESVRVYYYASAPGEGFCTKPSRRLDMALLYWVLAAGLGPLWLCGLGGALLLKMRDPPGLLFRST